MGFFCAILTALLTSALLPAMACAVSITVTHSGGGSYSVDGAAMDGVAGIDMTITYDSSKLSAPNVSQGSLISGAMMAANTNIPGSVKVAVISAKPFSGSGQIISLSFNGDSSTNSITDIKAMSINLKGVSLPTSASVSSGSQNSAGTGTAVSSGTAGSGSPQDSQYQTSTTGGGQTSGTTAVAGLGTLTLTGDSQQGAAAKSQEQQTAAAVTDQYRPAPEPAAQAEGSRAADSSVKPEKKSSEIRKITYPTVLGRFQTGSDERSMASFTGLFTRLIAGEFRQEPLAAVSDGTESVQIMAALPQSDDNMAPNFAGSDTKILKLKLDPDGDKWLLELQPLKGTITASVSILMGSSLYEIPLTTIPPVRQLSFTAEEIAAFLQDAGAAKPAFDLNGDGRHDYLDDYIYTGHYLLRSSQPEGVAE